MIKVLKYFSIIWYDSKQWPAVHQIVFRTDSGNLKPKSSPARCSESFSSFPQQSSRWQKLQLQLANALWTPAPWLKCFSPDQKIMDIKIKSECPHAHLSLRITSFSSTSICFRVFTTSTSISAARMSYIIKSVNCHYHKITNQQKTSEANRHRVTANFIFIFLEATLPSSNIIFVFKISCCHLLKFCRLQGVSIVCFCASALNLSMWSMWNCDQNYQHLFCDLCRPWASPKVI